MFLNKKKPDPISIPNIKKTGSSLNSDSLIRPSETSSKLIPITPRSSILSTKPSTIKFNPKPITSNYLLNINDFEPFNKSPISGGCGIIYFFRNKKSGKRYAVKTSKQQMSPEANKFILRELNILMKIQHPTIVHFEGFSLQDMQGNDRIMLFIDFMERGTLADIMEKEHRGLLPHEFDNTKRQIILIGIARGMMILHKNNVINRDLKPQNILIDDNFKPLITDFSLSKFFNPQNSQNQSMSCIGTYAYMAPEIIESNNYNTKADVYAFGILMYEFITGINAIDNIMNNKKFNQLTFFNLILNGKRPTFDSRLKIKPGFQRMIEKCWSNNPKERPTFSEIYSKLSLNDGDLYIDSENNICESIIKCEDEDNDKSLMSTNYCYDDVDLDELFRYIKEISETTNNTNNEEIELLKQRIRQINKYNQQMKEEIDELRKENENLKNNVAHVIDENTQIKNDIAELKKIIIQLQNKPKNVKDIDEETIEKKEIISFDPNAKEKKEVVQKDLMKLGIFELAKNAKEGIQTTIELPQFLQKIPDSLFKDCRDLLVVKIPSSVMEIGNSSFFGCSSLTEIIIPSSVNKIGDFAFSECSSLAKITIPSSITIIGDHVFYKCSALRYIEIPSLLIQIGDYAFSECYSLIKIEILSSVTKIGDNSFSGCSSLTEFKIIYSEAAQIGSSAFARCSSLKEITIPSVAQIGSSIFSGCSSLTKITIPSSVTKIGDHSFSGCSSLTKITIPSSVTQIGDYAFSGCLSLTEITIPASLTKIGSCAFDSDVKLIKVKY